jgi:hypothetical protein
MVDVRRGVGTVLKLGEQEAGLGKCPQNLSEQRPMLAPWGHKLGEPRLHWRRRVTSGPYRLSALDKTYLFSARVTCISGLKCQCLLELYADG